VVFDSFDYSPGVHYSSEMKTIPSVEEICFPVCGKEKVSSLWRLVSDGLASRCIQGPFAGLHMKLPASVLPASRLTFILYVPFFASLMKFYIAKPLGASEDVSCARKFHGL